MTEYLPLLMFLGVGLVLLSGYPVAFALGGTALAFAAVGAYTGNFDDAFLHAIPNRLYGIMTNGTLIAVPLFVFMGVMLERSRVAEELLETMASLFGSLRGGLGISVTVVGMLLAASTGIVGATVVTMGLLSLPTMLKRNYDPRLAAGTICAAGTLGQIIPPSIVLVLLGDVLSSAYQQAQLDMGIFTPDTVSVGDLFIGAIIPGLLLVMLYLAYQLAVAFFQPHRVPVVNDDEVAQHGAALWLRVISVLLPPMLLILAVLGSILAGFATPTEAAGVGSVGALLLAAKQLDRSKTKIVLLATVSFVLLIVIRRHYGSVSELLHDWSAHLLLTVIILAALLALLLGIVQALITVFRLRDDNNERLLSSVMRQTTLVSSMVFMILIGASVFSLVFRGFGGDEMVTDFLSDLPGGVVGAVVLVMLVMFLLGFILDFIEITFVVVPIVGPVLLAMGLDPVWLGIMIAINLQTSFLTPPFGFSLFYLRGVAPESVSTMQIYRGVLPFIVIQLIVLGLLAWQPELATWLPNAVYGERTAF